MERVTDMLDDALYVPVLCWKPAEMDALEELRAEHKSRLKPLLEIIPRPFQAKGGGPSPSVRDVLATIARDIARCWGPSAVFLDVEHLIKAGIREPSGSHLLEVLADKTRGLLPLFPDKSNLIPVTGLTRSEDDQNAVSSIVEEDKTGACFRITPREVSDRKLADKLEALLSRLRLDVADVDLLVDYQAPNDSHPDLKTLCESLPQLPKWRSFIVLIGAFPRDLQKLKNIGRHTLPRDDWLSWHDQVLALPRGIRRPAFGDYTIQHPIYKEPPEHSNPSASIRYTHSECWVIMRGEGLCHEGSQGNAQYPAAAKLPCEMDEFCGIGFSRGDRYIQETSRQPNSPGTPYTWLRAGINHHMTYATRQVQSVAAQFDLETVNQADHDY